MDEQQQIEKCYLSLRFAQKMRKVSLDCFSACGGEQGFPFEINQLSLMHNSKCFSACMNVRLEQGPFLNELGAVPDDAVPKKFLWHSGAM